MDKKIVFNKLVSALVKKDKKGNYINLGALEGNLIIEGKQLDKIIFEEADKLDKNIKYEFRNFLHIFDFIERYPHKVFYQNEGFKVNVKEIEKYIKGVKTKNEM